MCVISDAADHPIVVREDRGRRRVEVRVTGVKHVSFAEEAYSVFADALWLWFILDGSSWTVRPSDRLCLPIRC